MLLLLTTVPGTPGLKRSAGVRLSTSNNIDVLRDKLLSIMARKDQNKNEVKTVSLVASHQYFIIRNFLSCTASVQVRCNLLELELKKGDEKVGLNVCKMFSLDFSPGILIIRHLLRDILKILQSYVSLDYKITMNVFIIIFLIMFE